jgi:hypothetical protein
MKAFITPVTAKSFKFCFHNNNHDYYDGGGGDDDDDDDNDYDNDNDDSSFLCVSAEQLQRAILNSISVYISINMEQLRSHSAECYEILYW